MKLTIIKDDGAVYKDNVCYSDLSLPTIPSDVHALQWDNDKGSIEFVDNIKPNEQITQLPSWANDALTAWQQAYDEAHQPPSPPTVEQNKKTAILLLQQTDWTQIPSVSDSALSNPYLANKNAFDTYRNSVRQYALNPVAGDIVWPSMPQEVWTTV